MISDGKIPPAPGRNKAQVGIKNVHCINRSAQHDRFSFFHQVICSQLPVTPDNSNLKVRVIGIRLYMIKSDSDNYSPYKDIPSITEWENVLVTKFCKAFVFTR